MLQINGSIVYHKGKIWCACRTDNLYDYDSKSYLLELDENLDPLSSKKITAGNENPAFEDIRLFSYNDYLLAFYNYLPVDDNGVWYWKYIMGYGHIDLETGVINNQVSLLEFSKRYNEKNWIPYIFNNELHIISDFDPHLRILKVNKLFDDAGLECVFEAETKTDGWDYGEIRGGTALLSPGSLDQDWQYGFVHSSLRITKAYARYYYFTVIRLNHKEKKIEYYPIPLTLDLPEPDELHNFLWMKSNSKALKVIFPMRIMHFEDGVLVSFGIDDVSTVTNYYSWEYMLSLFKPLAGDT